MKRKLLSITLALSLIGGIAAMPAFASSANYEIIRDDESFFNERGTALLKQYYDRIFLLDGSESAAKINTVFLQESQNHLSDAQNNINAVKNNPPSEDARHTNFAEPTITKNDNGIFSVKVVSESFTGGGYVKYQTQGFTFDLATGEKLSPAKILGMSDADAEKYLKYRSLAYISTNKNSNWWPNAADIINQTALSDFGYYVEGDSVFVCYSPHVLAPANNGSAVIECPKVWIKVVYNGGDIAFDQPPVMKNDRVMVPVRAIFEALGYSLEWNQASQTATATKDGNTIAVTVGKPEISHSGGTYVCDVPAINLSGRVMVPVRAISESAGCSVTWDQANLTVNIK